MHESEFAMAAIPPIAPLMDDEESRIDMNPPPSGVLGKSSIIRPIDMETDATYYAPRPLATPKNQGSSTMNLRPQPAVEKNWRSGLYAAVAVRSSPPGSLSHSTKEFSRLRNRPPSN